MCDSRPLITILYKYFLFFFLMLFVVRSYIYIYILSCYYFSFYSSLSLFVSSVSCNVSPSRLRHHIFFSHPSSRPTTRYSRVLLRLQSLPPLTAFWLCFAKLEERKIGKLKNSLEIQNVGSKISQVSRNSKFVSRFNAFEKNLDIFDPLTITR